MSTPRTRIAAQAPLGFSAGLPPYLIGGTLVAWLATEGVSVQALGLLHAVQPQKRILGDLRRILGAIHFPSEKFLQGPAVLGHKIGKKLVFVSIHGWY